MAAAINAASPRKGVPQFKKLQNVTPEAVEKLFMPTKNPISKDPVLVIAIGSPGVGKTTSLIDVLNNEPLLKAHGITYNHFYNVSLDKIAEHIKPYRNETVKAYKYAKQNANQDRKHIKPSKINSNNYF